MNWTHCIERNGSSLIGDVAVARSLLDRMRGLLGVAGLGEDRGLYIVPCSAVHTIGMRFDLDLVFVDRELTVCRIVLGVVPGRVVSGGRGAAGVLETEAGWLAKSGLKAGDRLSLIARSQRPQRAEGDVCGHPPPGSF